MRNKVSSSFILGLVSLALSTMIGAQASAAHTLVLTSADAITGANTTYAVNSDTLTQLGGTTPTISWGGAGVTSAIVGNRVIFGFGGTLYAYTHDAVNGWTNTGQTLAWGTPITDLGALSDGTLAVTSVGDGPIYNTYAVNGNTLTYNEGHTFTWDGVSVDSAAVGDGIVFGTNGRPTGTDRVYKYTYDSEVGWDYTGETLLWGAPIHELTAMDGGKLTLASKNPAGNASMYTMNGTTMLYNGGTNAIVGFGAVGDVAIAHVGGNDVVAAVGSTNNLRRYHHETGAGWTYLGQEVNWGAKVVDMSVLLLAEPEPVLGDYNDNGFVDAADYVLWRNGGPLMNEANNPGVVNDQDYIEWRARFGNPTPGSSSGNLPTGTAVPEPGLCALLGWAFVGWITTSVRRRQA